MLKRRQVLRDGKDLQACIWWADGSVDFYGGAIGALEQVDDERIAGAYTVIDNAALGRVMAARAGRPLATVESLDLIETLKDAEAAGYVSEGSWVTELDPPA